MNYIAVKIYNNTLGKVLAVSSIEEGVNVIRGWAVDQLERSLTDYEERNLMDNFEIYVEDDPDNVFSYSVGIVEND